MIQYNIMQYGVTWYAMMEAKIKYGILDGTMSCNITRLYDVM